MLYTIFGGIIGGLLAAGLIKLLNSIPGKKGNANGSIIDLVIVLVGVKFGAIGGFIYGGSQLWNGTHPFSKLISG